MAMIKKRLKYFTVLICLSTLLSSFSLANELKDKGVVCNWRYDKVAKNSYSFFFENTSVKFYKFIFKEKEFLTKVFEADYEIDFKKIVITYENMETTIFREPFKFKEKFTKKYPNYKFVRALVKVNGGYKGSEKKGDIANSGDIYCIVTKGKEEFFKFFNKEIFLKNNAL